MSFLFKTNDTDPSGLESAEGIWINPTWPNELNEDLYIFLSLNLK